MAKDTTAVGNFFSQAGFAVLSTTRAVTGGKADSTVRRIDTKYFSTAIRELDTAIEAFNSALSNVHSQTCRLQNCWEGKGANKFNDAYGRLKQEFDDQAETLTAIRDDLQTILETYQSWDSQVRSDLASSTEEA